MDLETKFLHLSLSYTGKKSVKLPGSWTRFRSAPKSDVFLL